MRQLTAKDARDMAAIHAESFETSWSALDMTTHVRRDMCLGVEQDAKLAAFIILSSAAGQAEILTIATAKENRRMGLGRELLSQALDHLQDQEITEIFLEVAEDNHAALALYKKSGFQPIGRRPGYYRRAEGRVSAITFSKKL
jgi:ribosomal-protein-alanine N-acetyltransferase